MGPPLTPVLLLGHSVTHAGRVRRMSKIAMRSFSAETAAPRLTVTRSRLPSNRIVTVSSSWLNVSVILLIVMPAH